MLHERTTGQIINAFYKVYNTLGYGFLEKVYEKALAIELRKRGFQIVRQQPIKVHYDGVVVGNYFADIVVDNTVIIELKAMEALHSNHANQLVNYLKATEMEVGLLLNFGEEPEAARKIYTNDRKRPGFG